MSRAVDEARANLGRRVPRVLHCLWSGEIGGAERAVYQLVRGQLSDGSVAPSVLLAGGRGPWLERLRELGVEVIALDMRSGRSVAGHAAARRAMRPFDIHHFHAAEPVLMWASLRCRGAKRVYTKRGGLIEHSLKKRARHAVTAMLVRSGFHGVSGNTAHAAHSVAKLLHRDPESVRVTYNGIDFSLLRPKRPASGVRAELGLEPTDFVIGTVAILKSWKRIDRLVELTAAVSDLGVRLVVVGDGPERPRLESMVNRLGLADNVRFAGLSRNTPDYLQVMDVFCLPSNGAESFGNAAVEAMGRGVPTIVFADGGGLVEHIEDSETGFVVESQAELESTVRQLVSDTELRRTVGVRGREAVRDRYTSGKSVAAYAELYAEVLAGFSNSATI